MAVEFTITDLCASLDVSRSGYHAWVKRKPSARQLRNQALLIHITQAFEQGRKTYGSPRVTQVLKQQKLSCGRHRVARLMRQAGLRGLQKPGFRPRTTNSNHDHPIAPNRLKPMEKPSQPNQVWVADITYIRLLQGWAYLAVVMDLCSRKVVGWALQDHLKTSLPTEALQRALASRQPPSGLLHHSDRGVQYASGEYRDVLDSHQVVPSMSAQGDCYDNATMEAFFSTLKTELIHRQDWTSEQEVRLALFDYIETFYNRKRLHSSLGYQSPVEFEQALEHPINPSSLAA